VIPTIVTQALTRDRIELGALEPRRDFLYVADTVKGLARCAEAEDVVGEVLNLATGREHSIREVVDLVLGATGKELPVEVIEERLRPADSEVDRLCASVEKAHALLGWGPTIPFRDGLLRTIEWIAGSLDAYRPEVYGI
jgi:dTDP-glucose 4,6-dehydratase